MELLLNLAPARGLIVILTKQALFVVMLGNVSHLRGDGVLLVLDRHRVLLLFEAQINARIVLNDPAIAAGVLNRVCLVYAIAIRLIV